MCFILTGKLQIVFCTLVHHSLISGLRNSDKFAEYITLDEPKQADLCKIYLFEKRKNTSKEKGDAF
jgi:hypothetical protein